MPRCTVKQYQSLSDAQKLLMRGVLEPLCGKWSFWILHVIGEADRPMRFARIIDAVEGISQKILTQNLRQLECDGFLTRTIFPEVPPRVEYQLSDLGRDLLIQIAPLFAWVVAKSGAFMAARARFADRVA